MSETRPYAIFFTPAARCQAVRRAALLRDRPLLLGHLSDRTVRDVQDTLRAVLGSAVAEELLTRNVAAIVRPPVSRERKRNWWSVEEARAFLESARTDRDPLYAAYVLVLVLGLRRGEVLGLTWNDVNLDTAEVRITWQLQRAHGKLRHRETKTPGSEATLPLPDICVSALKLRAEGQARDRSMRWK